MSLPVPQSRRWQPLRSGLINLFHYANQQFWFEQGRLLLRGNNGTGKSRVLALQLPFLLDAELSPTRMEPDRSPSKRPEWNLLLGGKHRDRLGYTWLEFGRVDDDGQPDYFTIGCGMHAVKDRGRVDTWLFTTRQRIDQDLQLIRDEVPLKRALLSEALDDTGTVHRTRGEYCNCVDRELFGLRDRYRALMDLLIQLRVPQLSRDFDEKRISAQLSDALPPLPPEILHQVADALRDLDEQRLSLEETRRSADGVAQFEQSYAGYLQIALKRRINDFMEIHNRHDRTQRQINDDTRVWQAAKNELTETENGLRDNKAARAATEARLRTLRSRPEMDDHRRIEESRDVCQQFTQRLEQANQQFDQEQQRFDEQRKYLASELDHLKYDRQRVTTSLAGLASGEVPEPLVPSLAEVSEALVEDKIYPKKLDAVERACETTVRARASIVQQNDQIQHAVTALQRQVDRQSDFERTLDESRLQTSQAMQQLAHSHRTLSEAWKRWFEGAADILPSPLEPSDWLNLLDLPDDESGEADEDRWLDNPGEAVGELAAHAIEQSRSSTAAQRFESTTLLDHWNTQLDTLLDQQRELESGVHVPPPPTHTRSADSRVDRSGAPFYELCDFVDTVPDDQQPLWEAALEASGLLDAWMTPAGNLTDLLANADQSLGDVFLVDSASTPSRNHTPLSNVLQPAAKLPDGLTPPDVSRILEQLGCGSGCGEVWFDRDGSWQIGPQRGRWQKDAVEHIGSAAREQNRQRRLQQTRHEIETTRETLERVTEDLARLDEQSAQIKQLEQTRPDDREWSEAVTRWHLATKQAVEQEAKLSVQIGIVGEHRDTLSKLRSQRDRDAADLGLLAWIDHLDDLLEVLRQIESQVQKIRAQLSGLSQRLGTVERARRMYDEAMQRRQQLKIQVEQTAAETQAAQAKLQTLEESVGKDVQKIFAEIDVVEHQLQTLDKQSETLAKQERTLIGEVAKFATKLEQSQQQLLGYDDDRRSRIASLQRFIDEGWLGQTLDDEYAHQTSAAEWSPTRAAGIAKDLRDQLRGVPHTDRAWETSQNDLNVSFRTLEQVLLPSGFTPLIRTVDTLQRVQIPYAGVEQTPRSLTRTMTEDVRTQDALITQAEREIFEERLIGDIALSLHNNIREAHRLCQTMNAEVQSRPTSTGMRLRFRWKPRTDESDELKVACDSLLKQPAAMSDTEKASLGSFLQDRIAEARRRDDVGTWHSQLAEALDYRTWFAFEIHRQTDDKWERLTKRTHGTGSGGERAVSLIMPMLAALAAYYSSAPLAPRLILMDEAFVGIDNEMRAKFMDLLVQFDLDFIMTSEREWGCYPTMPRLAIYHLSTRRGIDAILATRWVWNGVQKEQIDSSAPAFQGELFDES